MAADSVSSVHRVGSRIMEAGKIRLVLQRLASGYYQRREVLREVAIRILRT